MYCAAVWQHSSNSNIKIVHNSIEHFLWNPSDSFSDDVLSCLWNAFTNSVFQAPPQKIVLGGWDLGNRTAQGYWFDAKWVCLMGSYAWGIQCSVQEMRWCLISQTVHSPHFSNRTLEYLRHNFPWDRLNSHQTDNPEPSFSQDLNSPDHWPFWGSTWKTEFVKTIHRQERTSSEEKSDGFHKKCSVEFWTILMFELLLCCHTAVQCMEQT